MKKIIATTFMGAALFTAPAFAEQDFLAEVTQGLFTDTTKGVYALTDTEKEKVLGGYWTSGVVPLQNVSLGFGSSMVQVGVAAELNDFELDNRVSCGVNIPTCATGGYVNQMRYNELVSVANPARGELLVVTATKTTRPGSFGVSIPTYTYGTAVFNRRTGWLTRTSSYTYVGSEMTARFRNEMNRVLAQYR